MKVNIHNTHREMARAAAGFGAELIREAVARRGRAVYILSTGMSQAVFLEELTAVPDVPWSQTTMFHLDDYIGLPVDHPASFDSYLRGRFIDKVHPGEYHLVDGNAADPEAECERYAALMERDEVDICFAGIGETAHLALNDPPADFDEPRAFRVIDTDRRSREQLAGEGWFDSWQECPARAITISIGRIMRCSAVISVVGEPRKANAVARTLNEPIGPDTPATILRRHINSHLFLDVDSAALLGNPDVAGGRFPVEFELGA
jgi:glucosamine-6-phosphate deaminase